MKLLYYKLVFWWNGWCTKHYEEKVVGNFGHVCRSCENERRHLSRLAAARAGKHYAKLCQVADRLKGNLGENF